ncbi:MAG: hypothetical protein RL150_736 [Candidatus Parcubacteria bacterium]|jgi:SET domain-containing protein
MLLIKTVVKPSTVPEAGLGLFADEDIPAGTVTWRYAPGFDQVINESRLATLSPQARALCLKYAYKDSVTGELILCGDDERFINHSENPNVLQLATELHPEGIEIAAWDIAKGEELFCNYYDFDLLAADKLKHTPYKRT